MTFIFQITKMIKHTQIRRPWKVDLMVLFFFLIFNRW